MRALNLVTGFMVAGLFAAAPAVAQSGSEQGGKQRTQEGGGSTHEPCSLPYNANPSADPNCRQGAHNLTPSPMRGSPGNQAANGNQR
jgi:hypothetical protein